jgi:serine/threonine protein kinase
VAVKVLRVDQCDP